MAGEVQLRPQAEESVRFGLQALAWKTAEFPDGVIDFARAAGAGEHLNKMGYAVCYVRSPQARRDLRLKFGSDDQSRLFLNGKLIGEQMDPGGLILDRQTVAGLDLQAGLNVILFKVFNSHGRWSGALRFVDEQDQPADGLEFTLNPD